MMQVGGIFLVRFVLTPWKFFVIYVGIAHLHHNVDGKHTHNVKQANIYILVIMWKVKIKVGHCMYAALHNM
jgi:hypothetical protein